MSKYKHVFIIGAGRSGTKYLRDTLFASESCTRIPYDVNYIWRYGNEGLSHDEISPENVDDNQREWIRRKLVKLIDKNAKRPKAKYIIEKSVPNALRPALLYDMFPEAKFIQVVRNGFAVTESAMRMWVEPPSNKYMLDKIRYFPWSNYKYGLWFLKNRLFAKKDNNPPVWGPRYKGIQEDLLNLPLHMICAKQWSACVSRSKEQLAGIPSGQVITVRYDELMDNTVALESICSFIGINNTPVIECWRKTVQKGNDNKWKTVLSESQINDIKELFQSAPR